MQDLFINNAIKPPFTNILYHPSAVLIQNCLKNCSISKRVVIPDIPDFKLIWKWLIWPHNRMNYLASFGRWLHQCSGSCFLKLPHGVVQQLGYSNVDFHLTAQLRLVYKRTKSKKINIFYIGMFIKLPGPLDFVDRWILRVPLNLCVLGHEIMHFDYEVDRHQNWLGQAKHEYLNENDYWQDWKWFKGLKRIGTDYNDAKTDLENRGFLT